MPSGRPPVDAKEIGKRLRESRGKRSREDVVRALQEKQGFALTAQHLYVIEKGAIDNPGAKMLDALAREYGETVEYLLYGVRPARKKGA